MNSAKNLCFLFLLSLTLVLTFLACGGGGGNSNSGDGYNPPDMLAGDQTDDASTTDDSNVKPDAGMVCDENGVCCDGHQCCNPGGASCWAQQPDAGEDTTSTDAGNDAETTGTYCNTDDGCEPEEWCDLYLHFCRPDNMPEIQPYKFLEADWLCLEGGVMAVGNTYPLKLTGWDEETHSAKAEGLLGLRLTFKYDGAILLLVEIDPLKGESQLFHPQYNNTTHQISFDWDEAGQYHSVFELQAE